nr:retrotransposon protein, putative, Ty1-copia subclass [Tanacetum cinerariifolium]
MNISMNNKNSGYCAKLIKNQYNDERGLLAPVDPPKTPRYADFLEREFILQKESGGTIELDDEDTIPSENTSEHPIEVESLAPIIEEDVVPVRRSARTPKAPNRLCLNVEIVPDQLYFNVEVEEHSLGDKGEPANLPPGAKVVKSKWIYKKKTDMDGVMYIYKARLVAKGFTQTYGVDYEETFSPVANIRAIRIFIAIAAYYDHEIWQMDVKTAFLNDIRAIRILIAIVAYYDYDIWKMDVKTAFLNGRLDEDIYMEQPEGYVDPKYPNGVCKLQRAMYGLKQASRQWNKRFDEEIKRFGFIQNRDEPCVYRKASGSDVVFLILYVDDILIMGNNIPRLKEVKDYLGECFSVKDLGEGAYILGITIYRDRSLRLIGLNQSAYIDKILKKFNMQNSKKGLLGGLFGVGGFFALGYFGLGGLIRLTANGLGGFFRVGGFFGVGRVVGLEALDLLAVELEDLPLVVDFLNLNSGMSSFVELSYHLSNCFDGPCWELGVLAFSDLVGLSIPSADFITKSLARPFIKWSASDGNDKVIMWYKEPMFGLEFCVVDLFDSFPGFNQRFVKSPGSESRPPMLNKDNYVPWSSRLLRYANSRPNGKLIHNSILNGPYVRKMIPELGDVNRDITTILLSLPEYIYAVVDSSETAQEIWLRVQQMMKGSDIGIQEKKAKLFNEWERFTSNEGESIESYYHRFLKLMKRNKHFPEKIASNLKFLKNLQPEWSRHIEADDQAIQTILLGLPEDIYADVDKEAKLFNEWERFTSNEWESIESYYHRFLKLMNDLKRNKHFPKKIANNLKFLNNLQPEWSRHVTIVHQTKDLHTADYTQLYDFLKYNQKEVDELKDERLAKIHDPLALMANSNNPYVFPAPHQDQSSFNQTYLQQPIPNPEDIIDPTTAMNMALALMAKAFKLNYSTPTNNNQRMSSNPKNRQIAQPGMNMDQDRQMQMVGGNGGNQFRQYAGQNAGNSVGYNDVIGHQVIQNVVHNPRVQNVGNQNGLIGVQGNGSHYARNRTVRPKRRDDAYLQTQLLIAHKEEVGIQLQAEEYDLMAATADLDEIEEVNANCILMANLQQASTSGTQTDSAPVYDTDGSAEVHENCDDNEIINMFTQEEQYTELLEPIPEPHQIPQNDNDVIFEDTSVEQGRETVEQHPANFKETRALYESLYQNLAIEVEKVKSVNRKLKETNADLTTELARFNIVSQDIMIIVQNESVVDTSELQTEIDRTKERFENCIIKKETEYAKLWSDWYKKCDECKYDKISYDKAYKDMQQTIEWLQAQLGDLKGKSKDTSCVSDTRNPLSQKLENENVELEFQVLNYARENAHLKATYKNLFDSISVSRAQTKTIIASLQNKLQSNIYKNAKLRTQLFKKVSDQKDNTLVTSENTKFTKQPSMENLPKVGKTNALSNPVTSNSVSTPQETKGVNNDKVIAPGMFRINPSKTFREEKQVPNTVSASARTKSITVSQPHVITKKECEF